MLLPEAIKAGTLPLASKPYLFVYLSIFLFIFIYAPSYRWSRYRYLSLPVKGDERGGGFLFLLAGNKGYRMSLDWAS